MCAGFINKMPRGRKKTGRAMCTVPDCGKFSASKGYCMFHRRALIGKFPSDSTEAKKISDKRVRKHIGTDIFKARQNTRSLLYNQEIKLEVLTHYSPDGALKCSAAGCEVTDADMLTLDHINNDGAKDRGWGRGYAGVPLYGILKRENYPSGFATLCCNHQNKKDLLRRRESAKHNILLVKSAVELATMLCGLDLTQEVTCLA